MIEKTYNFGQFTTMNDQQLDDFIDSTLASVDIVIGWTHTASDAIDECAKKVIVADRKNTIKRLRELGEEKARFVADTLENDWFFGRK